MDTKWDEEDLLLIWWTPGMWWVAHENGPRSLWRQRK
jgi:hypothetical protein